MFVLSVVTGLCTAGAAFYVQFLDAPYRECKSRLVDCWARLRLGSGQSGIAETAGAQKKG
jgi:hypothetical protein